MQLPDTPKKRLEGCNELGLCRQTARIIRSIGHRMIVDIFDQITGSQRPSLLSQQEFPTLHELYSAYERAEGPALLIVAPEDLHEVLTWIELEDDVCLTTDPESLVEHRLQGLALPDRTKFDRLTGLLNREAFHEALLALGNDASLEETSVLLCDVDLFKHVNNLTGHQRGDEILSVMGDILATVSTERDLVARYGGEDFAVLSDRDRASAEKLAEEIRRLVESRFASDSGVTLRIGIATERQEHRTQLMHKAEKALFAAKAAGRNCCLHFEELRERCERAGQDTGKASLEDRTRVLPERVARFVTAKCGKLVNQFRQAGDIDTLTQFYNRGYLDRRLAREVQDAQVPMCIAFADVDHFGEVNKEFGWPTGDKVLREVGELIRGQLREHDWVGRYGGEEFCIVMQNTRLSDSFPILERLREAVERHDFRSTQGAPLSITLSIGAVESTSDESHEVLVERASARTLAAKQEGRNRVLI